MKERKQLEIDDDTWIPSHCARCFSNCAIRVHRVNGVAVRIEGNPDSWQGSRGGVCAKGASGLQLLYDPNRLNVPLRRTNPEKGLYADPKWKEISWDEALNEIAEKIKKVLDDDPRKIFIQSTVIRSPTATLGWRKFLATVFGTPNGGVGGAGIHCGNGGHWACGLTHGSWDILPDYKHCNYAIYWGVNNGHATGHGAGNSQRLVSEATDRGMKLVVFDPICNYSGAKAAEWVPIIPGTDGAVLLAMCNVILNELGIWDAQYLKTKTNGPYLVGPDGRFVRDRQTHKPLVWDAGADQAKVFDDASVTDYALEGTYRVNGVECSPSFQLVKNHLKEYSPEKAYQVSQVPPETIRRIAAEFAEAAQIGSTITIGGRELPFRPVSSVIFRGGQGHGNAFHTSMAVCLLSQIVGAADVPGGTLAFPNTCQGYPETGQLKFGVGKGPDGMLIAPRWMQHHPPWPIEEPAFPTDAGLQELFTMTSVSPIWTMKNYEELWEKVKLPYRLEVMLNFGCNSVLGAANPEAQADFLKNIPFIVSWDLFANEFAEGFADILLPDTSYLESFTWVDGQGFNFNYPPGTDPWCYHVMQPAVEPAGSRRNIMDVSFELVDKLGKRAQANNFWNNFLGLDQEERFKPDEKATWEEVGDKALKHYFGKEHGVEWFKEHGFISWPKKIEETYWRCFSDVRAPIYMEFMFDQKEKLKKIATQVGIDLNWDQHTPYISWFPCAPHLVKDVQYDLYCFAYRDILHTSSSTAETPWLDEASDMNPYTYSITMNAGTAKQKGLKDGDVIEIESAYGNKTRGTLKTRKGQHPQTVAMVGTGGHWAKGQPVAKGKGTNFNLLMDAKLEECDPISLNLELCVKVKVNKLQRK
ncbi:MAG: molybdopterin-dependent oxidoreductase [Syntrophorhabdales bacterium]|jgi:molybdopterin-containing oxidoreductase family molybdopterin binding subunit